MRVLLTGASGFVGGHAAAALHRAGHELRLLTRASSDLSRLDAEQIPYERVVVDLDGDRAGLDAACEGVEAVVHIAARLRGRSEAEFMRTNADATAALGSAARNAGVGCFVYLSSLAAQGPAPGDAPEPTDVEPHPTSDYGRSKLAGEQALAETWRGAALAMIRAPLIYGPADRGLLPFFQAAERGFAPQLGDGSNRVAGVYGPDLAEAITAILERPPNEPAIWQISDGGGAYTWRDLLAALEQAAVQPGTGCGIGAARLLAALEQAAGRALRIIPLPPAIWSAMAATAEAFAASTGNEPLLDRSRAIEMRQPAWLADGSALEAATGWRPKVGIEQGIAETMRWYRQQNWL